MHPEQKAALEAPFSPLEVKQREGNFGQMLDYVEGASVIRRLNEALDGDWSFEIVEHLIREESSEVIVVGKLRVGDIVKVHFGSSKITRQRGTGETVSLGDDLKAAATDALKKCATLLGVALYLYNGSHQAESVSIPATTESPASGVTPASPQQPATPATPISQRGAGSSSNARLSARQHQLILKLSAEARISGEELKRHCQQSYGRTLDFLTKTDASKLIESLLSGQLKAA